jgi:hypothetical protein
MPSRKQGSGDREGPVTSSYGGLRWRFMRGTRLAQDGNDRQCAAVSGADHPRASTGWAQACKGVTMIGNELWIGALQLVLRQELSDCALAAYQAVGVLERIAELPESDAEMRGLCESMCERLLNRRGRVAP